jgi:hypothetical protein
MAHELTLQGVDFRMQVPNRLKIGKSSEQRELTTRNGTVDSTM